LCSSGTVSSPKRGAAERTRRDASFTDIIKPDDLRQRYSIFGLNMRSDHKFSHIGKNKEASMVPVDHKKSTLRTAVAECRVTLPPELEQALKDNELHTSKGAVF